MAFTPYSPYSFVVRNIRTHKLISITGLLVEQYDEVTDDTWATAWTNRADAEATRDWLMNDFGHPLAGEHYEVYPVRY